MERNLHNNSDFHNQEAELFARLQIPWERSKEDVWGELSKKMEQPRIEMKPRVQLWKYAAAAILVLTIGSTIFMRTYTVTKEALAAQHIETVLPDGSKVQLNAESKVSYKPYWWWQSRQVALAGEAYFNVQKGEKFQVESKYGVTEVLGTSFNIFAREDRYEVTCLTGKVKVSSTKTNDAVILHPSQKANLEANGKLHLEKEVNTEDVKAWMSNLIVFTSVPLIDVFKEVERQYKIKIIVPKNLNDAYTGRFPKNNSAEEALKIICRAHKLNVIKKRTGVYQITN